MFRVRSILARACQAALNVRATFRTFGWLDPASQLVLFYCSTDSQSVSCFAAQLKASMFTCIVRGALLDEASIVGFNLSLAIGE